MSYISKNMEFRNRNYEDCKEVEVSFGIRGDSLLPKHVSDLLEISPTRSFAKGDQFKDKSGIACVRPFGIWSIQSNEFTESTDPEQHLLCLIEKLNPKIELLIPFIEDAHYYVAFWIWWEGTERDCGYVIDSKVLEKLSVMCNEVNFTFIGA